LSWIEELDHAGGGAGIRPVAELVAEAGFVGMNEDQIVRLTVDHGK
jgi:hypothetical protein